MARLRGGVLQAQQSSAVQRHQRRQQQLKCRLSLPSFYVLYGCMFCELVLPVCATQPGAVTTASTVFCNVKR